MMKDYDLAWAQAVGKFVRDMVREGRCTRCGGIRTTHDYLCPPCEDTQRPAAAPGAVA